MFRTLGFILGSAISIGGILLVLGVPEFHLSTFELDQARFDAALEKVRDKKPVVERAVEEFVDKLVAEVKENHVETPSPLEIPEPESMVPEQVATEEMFNEAEEVFNEAQDVFITEQNWYEFWNPFRSEIAAQGFVSQLEKVTGLDYRIVKVKAGVYQVGFAYGDDDERRIKISRISAATGLELPQT